MKKQFLNGTPIPYDLPITELKRMLSSPVMKEFSLACEALSYHASREAYEAMKPYAMDKDKYRRLYILKTIFRHPEARAELTGFLEGAISSDDFLFVGNGLTVVAEYQIKVSECLLLAAVTKHLSELSTDLYALSVLDSNEENYIKLTEIFKKAEQCGQKETLGKVLTQKYLPSKAKELFDLFGCDPFAKIRLLALRLGKAYGYDLSKFLSDMDGHVKKLAANATGEMSFPSRLSFLSEYAATYHIDISDDLDSAVIYHPTSDEHLDIEYMRDDEYTPYLLSFSFQHVHVTDAESAKEWIDDILAENKYAIEYFSGNDRRFGGEISAEEREHLSYELLEQAMGYCGVTKLFQIVDNFKVRGWSGKNDLDGRFVERDGKINIEIIPQA